MSSCKPKTETIVETVIQVDTVQVFIHESATTFILTRHAEITEGGSNPSLSAEGKARAQFLSEMLANVDLLSVYATDYNRTQETAQITADAQGLSVTSYDPFDQVALAEEILAMNNETVLVVGHSNTIPELLNLLSGSDDYETFEEDEFDNLFIVHTSELGIADVVHLKY
jgi:2,3-bisphosphoglycerate-dependent phosphoglycerate mutase